MKFGAHNVSAMLVQIVVFAMIGAVVGGASHWTRRSGH
jgi:hypothetical protein